MFVRAVIEAMDVCEEAKEQRYEPNNSILQALGQSGREGMVRGIVFPYREFTTCIDFTCIIVSA